MCCLAKMPVLSSPLVGRNQNRSVELLKAEKRVRERHWVKTRSFK